MSDRKERSQNHDSLPAVARATKALLDFLVGSNGKKKRNPNIVPPLARATEALLDLFTPTIVEKKKPARHENSSETLPALIKHDFIPADISAPPSLHLKLKRTQRETRVLSNPVFMLDARMGVSKEERQLISKYRLGPTVVYDSANREKYQNQAREYAESTREHPALFGSSPGALALGAAKTFFRIGRAGVSAGLASLSLR
ncbi:MAG: hypothetical protein K8F62_17300, partial [Pseudorhodoplanes sp.]|nr:hypothetical protein [Pseudorhodoplanes sp.]